MPTYPTQLPKMEFVSNIEFIFNNEGSVCMGVRVKIIEGATEEQIKLADQTIKDLIMRIKNKSRK